MKTINKFAALAAACLISTGALAEEIAAPVEDKIAPAAELLDPVPESEPVAAKSKNGLPKGIQFGVGVSATSGGNLFIGYANKNFDSFWWKRFGVRLDFATMSPIKSSLNKAINNAIDDSVDLGDNLYVNDFDLGAKHYAALVDFYPFGNTWFLGGLRVTGGYVAGNINLSAKLTGGAAEDAIEFELGDDLYRYDGGDITGKAGIKWKYSGPYLGGGFDLGLFAGFKIYLDAGVVLTSKTAQLGLNVPITSDLQVWDDGAGDWKGVEAEGLEAEFEQAKHDALADAQDELDKVKAFPMVKLGFMYRF